MSVSDESGEDFIFIAIGDEENLLRDFAVFETVDEAKAHRFSKKSKKNQKASKSEEESFGSIINNMVNSFSDYYHVADISAFMPRVFANSMLRDGFDKLATEENCVYKTKNKKIYRIHEKSSPTLMNSMSESIKYGKSLSVLPSAVLLSIVATFDAHLSSLAKLVLKSQPLSSIGKGKQVSVSEILKYSDFEDLKNSIIEEEVYSLMFESHGSQAEKIEKFFNIEIRDRFPEWSEFIEIFERRNLVAHGEGFANSIYIKSLQKNGVDIESSFCLKIGDKALVSRIYLQKSLDTLLNFLFLVAWTTWVKKEKKEFVSAYERANEICYDLIKLKRYALSSRLLSTFIDWVHKDVPERTKRMMVINKANAVKLDGNEDLAKEIVDRYDWSASSDDFVICTHAIRGDLDKVCGMMEKFQASAAMGKDAFREWPVFSPFFADEKYRERFLEIFMEDFDPHLVQ